MYFRIRKNLGYQRLLNRKLTRIKKPEVIMPDGSIRTLSPVIMGLAKRMSQRLHRQSE